MYYKTDKLVWQWGVGAGSWSLICLSSHLPDRYLLSTYCVSRCVQEPGLYWWIRQYVPPSESPTNWPCPLGQFSLSETVSSSVPMKEREAEVPGAVVPKPRGASETASELREITGSWRSRSVSPRWLWRLWFSAPSGFGIPAQAPSEPKARNEVPCLVWLLSGCPRSPQTTSESSLTLSLWGPLRSQSTAQGTQHFTSCKMNFPCTSCPTDVKKSETRKKLSKFQSKTKLLIRC